MKENEREESKGMTEKEQITFLAQVYVVRKNRGFTHWCKYI